MSWLRGFLASWLRRLEGVQIGTLGRGVPLGATLGGYPHFLL